MPYLSLPGHHEQLWFAAHGDAGSAASQPPLALVHGAGGAHLDWPGALRRLPGWRTLAVDLPGHGRSDLPGCDSIAGYADALVRWLDALGIERAVWCGHSMGGGVCLALALDHPDRAAVLVLIGAGARFHIPVFLIDAVLTNPMAVAQWVLDRAWSERTPEEVRRASVRRMLQTPPAVLRDNFLAEAAFDVNARLGEVRAPTLVIGAAGDRLTPLALSQQLAAGIPAAELVVIEEAGHMMPLEQPAAVADTVARFLERVLRS